MASVNLEETYWWIFCKLPSIGWPQYIGASLVAQMVNNLPAMQETRVQSRGLEDPLEKGMATYSSILTWRISWIKEFGGLQSMWQRVQNVWANRASLVAQMLKKSACNVGGLGPIPNVGGLGRSPGEGIGNLLQYFCLENSVDKGVWWAIVNGVAKSRTRLSN